MAIKVERFRNSIDGRDWCAICTFCFGTSWHSRTRNGAIEMAQGHSKETHCEEGRLLVEGAEVAVHGLSGAPKGGTALRPVPSQAKRSKEAQIRGSQEKQLMLW